MTDKASIPVPPPTTTAASELCQLCSRFGISEILGPSAYLTLLRSADLRTGWPFRSALEGSRDDVDSNTSLIYVEVSENGRLSQRKF